MDDTTVTMFGGDRFGPLLERAVTGELVTIRYHGLRILTFERRDPIARDLVIDALLRVGIKGKTVAVLCDVSEGHVTGVRQRVARGGSGALAMRKRGGTTPTITGRVLARAIELRDARHSIREIARQIGRSKSAVAAALARHDATVQATAPATLALPLVATATEAVTTSAGVVTHADAIAEATATKDEASETVGEELRAATPIAPGPTEHASRYAGTLLLCAAVHALGLAEATHEASVRRSKQARYDALQALLALVAAWTAGMGSIEAMHERDAGALGIVLGLERSPSVRTLQRAIAQMVGTYDPSAWSAAWLKGVPRAFAEREVQLFGIDGHIKAYKGDAPIDKGWDSKRRIATRAVAEVRVSDDRGVTWWHFDVPPGDHLSQHLLTAGTTTRSVLEQTLQSERPIVLAFDRGGFDFDVLAVLDREGLYYVAYVPASVSMPALDGIAPARDGVGEVLWAHERLDHPSRLLVERDDSALIPVTTNLPTLIDSAECVQLLRSARGWQENAIKAARAFAHIDRLVDRGVAQYAPDDRAVSNPVYRAQEARLKKAQEAEHVLCQVTLPSDKNARRVLEGQQFLASMREGVESKKLGGIAKKVPQNALDPEAQRAWLRTRNRMLLAPVKNAMDNARRWLLERMGASLSPTDHAYDTQDRNRTLLALLRAPGTVRFERTEVIVTIGLQLPPTAHRRIQDGLAALCAGMVPLRFTDGVRTVRFQLAPRARRTEVARDGEPDDDSSQAGRVVRT